MSRRRAEPRGVARAVSGLVAEYTAGEATRAALTAENERLRRRLAELAAELQERLPAERARGPVDALAALAARLGIAALGPRELAP